MPQAPPASRTDERNPTRPRSSHAQASQQIARAAPQLGMKAHQSSLVKPSYPQPASQTDGSFSIDQHGPTSYYCGSFFPWCARQLTLRFRPRQRTQRPSAKEISRETNIQTEPPQACPDAWLPRPLRDSQRSKSAPSTPRQGPVKTRSVINKSATCQQYLPVKTTSRGPR